MDLQLIDVKLIDIPKADTELRSFSKEFATRLADSIKVEGMYNPIVLRPNPLAAGRFLLVQGRHRLYAKKNVLKETHIEANVIADMDDQDAEMAMIAENLWRNPLTKNQHLKAIKRWWEHFATKNPDKIGRGTAATKARVRKQEEARSTGAVEPSAGSAQSDDSAETGASTEAGDGVNFAEMVSAATGKSLASSKRDAKIAKSFNEEQLEAFDQMKVTQADMTRIAKIQDEARRGEVVNLIASGMEVEDALKEVLQDAIPAAADGQAKEDREAKRTAREEKAPNLSDDEWFATFCGEKARMLGNPAKYKADALLFRAVADLRHAFRSRGKKHLATTKKAGVTGALFNLINRFVSVSHPKDWLICEACKGTGESSKGGKCEKCFGGGYALKTETYL